MPERVSQIVKAQLWQTDSLACFLPCRIQHAIKPSTAEREHKLGVLSSLLVDLNRPGNPGGSGL
jgi:hypothetical protein